MATYLSPKIDFSFKKVFGNDHYCDITINFLNSMLELKDEDEIKEINFKDPAKIKDSLLQANSFVDVHCTDKKGRHFLIEMSTCAKASADLRQNFGYISHISIKQKNDELHNSLDNNFLSAGALAQVDVELPKFTKTIKELKSKYDEWLFFLQNAAKLNEIPEQLNNLVFQHAFHMLDKMTWTEEEFDSYIAQMDKADRPRREEIARLEEAIEKGAQQEKEIVARNLLKLKVSLDTIIQATGLSMREIEHLRSKI